MREGGENEYLEGKRITDGEGFKADAHRLPPDQKGPGAQSHSHGVGRGVGSVPGIRGLSWALSCSASSQKPWNEARAGPGGVGLFGTRLFARARPSFNTGKGRGSHALHGARVGADGSFGAGFAIPPGPGGSLWVCGTFWSSIRNLSSPPSFLARCLIRTPRCQFESTPEKNKRNWGRFPGVPM